MELIYFIIIILATFIGSSAGIGGGVIIKPALDAINMSDIATIGFISSCSVLTMSIYSSIKQAKTVKNFDFKMIGLIGIGSVLGGILGNKIFSYFLTHFDDNVVKATQSLMLSLLLTGVLLNNIYSSKTFKIENKFVIFLIGFILGTVSSFLGIGGGPINVAVFVVLFSCDIKTAAIYSLATIIFTQTSSLTTMYIANGFKDFDLRLLIFAIPAALLGGFIGTKYNKQADEKTIERLFRFTTAGVVILNIYNFFVAISAL